MKKISFLNSDTLIIVLLALMIGFFAGRFLPSKCLLAINTTIHNIYVKFHPNSQKDAKTIIIEKATKDMPNLPQNNIFEEPTQKENKLILYIKRIFSKEQKSEPNIHDFILH